MFKSLFTVIILFSSLESHSSSFWTPDSDTAVLMDLLVTSQGALRATLDLVEAESKTLDRIEQVQNVVEEKHNKVLTAVYLTDSAIGLGKSLSDVRSVSDYTGKIVEANNMKDATKGYFESVKSAEKIKNRSDKIVQDSVLVSTVGKKFKDKVNHKGYTGLSASTKAGVDSARNSSVLVDQLGANNLILSQIYNQNRTKAELASSRERLKEYEVNSALRQLGVLSKRGNGPYASNKLPKNKKQEIIINMSYEDMQKLSSEKRI
jgi:hypothetical protein